MVRLLAAGSECSGFDNPIVDQRCTVRDFFSGFHLAYGAVGSLPLAPCWVLDLILVHFLLVLFCM